jgi:hypothetical protein
MGWLRRKLRCPDCGFQIEETMRHDDPLPDCPTCARASEVDAAAEKAADDARVERMVNSGRPPGVVGNRSKAMDIAQRMSEEMGFTDMNDSGRAGEAAYKAPGAMPRAEFEQVVAEMKAAAEAVSDPEAAERLGLPANPQAFQQAMAPQVVNPGGDFNTSPVVMAGRMGTEQSRAQGVDTFQLRNAAKKSGALSTLPKLDVVGRAKMTDAKTA